MAAEQQPVSDEQLAAEVQGGCLSAFEELVTRHKGRIYRFVANSLRHETDACDVTQETFVTAYQKIGQFKRGRSFAAWLFTIARRKCIDRHRARRPELNNALPEIADANDPSMVLGQREAEKNLWDFARHTLPELQFQALWLRYAGDLSVADIARALGRTQIHVKVLLFRARTRLASELEKQSVDGPTGMKVRATAKPTAAVPTVIQQISHPYRCPNLSKT